MVHQARGSPSEVSRPQLIQSMIDAMRVPDLRAKILFTLAMLTVFRFVAHVPVLGVDIQALNQAFQQQALLGFLDLFSGGALSRMSVAALGVYPYITASTGCSRRMGFRRSGMSGSGRSGAGTKRGRLSSHMSRYMAGAGFKSPKGAPVRSRLS